MSTRSPEDGPGAREHADAWVEAIARAMTAHPVPDLAAHVHARLARSAAPRSGLRPLWAAAALAAAGVVGLRLAAPEPRALDTPPPTVAGSMVPAPAPRLDRGGEPRPATLEAAAARPAPAARVPARRGTALRVPTEPWPGEELHARPLRYEPLGAPPVTIDAIGLDPLAAPRPLTLDEGTGASDEEARSGEVETR